MIVYYISKQAEYVSFRYQSMYLQGSFKCNMLEYIDKTYQQNQKGK